MMMRFATVASGVVLGVLAASLLAACSGGSGSASQNTQATIQTPGQEIFLAHCMGCHMGAGDPPGPNDIILKSSKMASVELLKSYLRQPGNNAMPPISASDVPDADVGKLYAYLKSVH